MEKTVTIEELKAQYEDMRTSQEKLVSKLREIESENSVLKTMKATFGNESMEKQVLSSFGVKEAADLINVNTALPRYALAPASMKLFVKQLKEDIDIARWTAQVQAGIPDNSKAEEAGVRSVKNIFDTKFAKEVDLKERVKALSTTANPELIMTAVSSQYIEEFELERRLQNMFMEMPLATSPFDLPVLSGVTQARLIGEGASLADASFDTSKIRFTAKKLGERYLLPEELNEDSVPSIMTIARNELQKAHQRAIENALINGDNSLAHMDLDVTAADDARKAWKGFRHLALNNPSTATVNFGAAISTEKLDDLILIADKFGINVRDCIFVASVIGYNQMVALPEVTSVDKFGPMATILSGALAAFRGRGIVVSEYMRNDLDATGIYGATVGNNIKTGILLLNKERFMIGRRRPLRMRVGMDERYEFDRWQMAAYQRVDFQGHAQSATEKSVVFGLNASLS